MAVELILAAVEQILVWISRLPARIAALRCRESWRDQTDETFIDGADYVIYNGETDRYDEYYS